MRSAMDMNNTNHKTLPQSARKHIRRQKAHIRREFPEGEDRADRIAQVYAKFGYGPTAPKEVQQEEKKEAKPTKKPVAEASPAKSKETVKKDKKKAKKVPKTPSSKKVSKKV